MFMPEKVNDKTVFSLLEVAKSIQKTLSERYKNAYWIKAEMNKLNYYRHSGHCYPELVEKKDGKIIAQLKAHLWKVDYQRINTKFQDVLKEPLQDGIKILFLARIVFDPDHGLGLWILDIDPSYTLGDLEQEKQNTIQRLRSEDIYDRNKRLTLPLLPQRIAIISVETSKGYADFLKVLQLNSWGYSFFSFLFPSLLQGDNAVASILRQLNTIKRVKKHFDVVAIIRGGGGDVGLSCYNNYELSKEIALFPIPVITGIGHATNETVAEMVSFSNAITPTKLAEYLIQKFHDFSVPVKDAQRIAAEYSTRRLREEKVHLTSEVKLFRSITTNTLTSNQAEVKSVQKNLFQQSRFLLRKEKEDILLVQKNILKWAPRKSSQANVELIHAANALGQAVSLSIHRFSLIATQWKDKLIFHGTLIARNKRKDLNNIEKNVLNMSPHNVLRRGYSISKINNKVVTDFKKIKSGDALTTILLEGSVISVVQSTKPGENE